MRTHAVLQNAVLVLYFTDFSQQTAISHAQHLESTSPTQNRGLHVRLCSGASVIFQIRNVRKFVSSPQSTPNLSVSFYFCLFVPLLLAVVHSLFHLHRKMLPLVLRADLRSFTVPVYALQFTALLQLVTLLFYYLTRTFVLKYPSVSLILSFLNY